MNFKDFSEVRLADPTILLLLNSKSREPWFREKGVLIDR